MVLRTAIILGAGFARPQFSIFHSPFTIILVYRNAVNKNLFHFFPPAP
jgi:hypothetical protein